MLPIGINGFGRIGKCVFLQLIESKTVEVKVINAPDFDINKLESYLKRDSVHKYNTTFSIKIVDNDTFKINNRTIHLLRNRDARELNWKSFGIYHIIDATGVYLTKEAYLQLHSIQFRRNSRTRSSRWRPRAVPSPCTQPKRDKARATPSISLGRRGLFPALFKRLATTTYSFSCFLYSSCYNYQNFCCISFHKIERRLANF